MKLQDWKRVSAEAKKQGIGMQRKLTLYWILMVVVVFVSVLLLLGVSSRVPNTTRELEEVVLLQHENNKSQLTGRTDALAAQCVALSETAGREIGELLDREGLAFRDLDDNPRALRELETRLTAALGNTMRVSRCSGAYVVLDATTNTEAENAADSRSGVYLRTVNQSALEKSRQSLTCFRGDPEVARAAGLPLHSRWDMEFRGSTLPGFEGLMGTRPGRAEENCFWSGRITLPGTWEKVLLLSAPVLDRDGRVCGLCGVEQSELCFRLACPGIESSYGRIVTLLAPVSDGNILLDNAMIGGAEGTWLEPCGIMEKARREGEYRIGKDSYYGLHEPLDVGIAPAPEAENGPELVTLVSTENVRSSSARVTALWIGVLVLLLVFTTVLSVVFSRRFVRPILSSLEAIRTRQPLEESRSGISEVDDLLTYISSREKETASAESLPPNVEELLSQFSRNIAALTPTERSILRSFIEGYDLTETASRSFVSVNTVKKHNTNINRKLGVTSREELLLYVDLFRRCGRLSEITEQL